MVTVTIAQQHARHIPAIKRALESAVRDLDLPDLSNSEFQVEAGDFTCLDGIDEIMGTELLHRIVFPILTGETDAPR